MNIHLILIGNELLNGKIQDKNAAWLASFTHENHFKLDQVHIVPDDEQMFKETLKAATKSADIVLTSGGLGPTQDDLTKKMMAKFFDKTIAFSESSLSITQNHYSRYQREYQQDKFDYHNIPKDFIPFHNPVGFAPGLGYYFDKNKFIASAPGVPSEFRSMVEEVIFPYLKEKLTFDTLLQKHVTIKTWKVPESKIFMKMAPGLWERLSEIGQVSSLPHLGGVDIGVEIKAETWEEIKIKEKQIISLINETEVKDHVWNIGSESLEEVIVQKAISKNLKIGFAESCTGGLCASRITDISGSSAVFWGSIVSYSNEVKMKALGVSEQTLKDHGAVSLETAKEMATGALKNMNLDIAITTTGIAGPGGGSIEKPVGTVGIGVATKTNASSEVFQFQGNREQLKFRFSQVALFKLLEEIMKY